MVVSAVRDCDKLQENTFYLLLANICFSNLLISFLVKPISAVYVAYSLTTGQREVGLAFCSLYTLTFRPTELSILNDGCKIKALLRGFQEIFRNLFNNNGKNYSLFTKTVWGIQRTGRTTWLVLPLSLVSLCWLSCLPQQEVEHEASQLEPETEEFEEMKRAMAFPTIKQKSILGCIWFFASLYGLSACFPEKVMWWWCDVFIRCKISRICNQSNDD